MAPGPGGVVIEAVQPQFHKPRSPFPDRLLGDAHLGHDHLVRQSSAPLSTILDRNANACACACDGFRRHAHRCSCLRS